jgi:hypothetical protein
MVERHLVRAEGGARVAKHTENLLASTVVAL